MISAIKKIGDYKLKKENKSYIDQLIENPNSNGNYKNVLIIVFESDGEKTRYKTVINEEFSKQKIKKYAYKSGAPRGGDVTPTSKITKLEKTFERIQLPLKKINIDMKDENIFGEIIMQINRIFQDEKLSKKIFQNLKELTYEDDAILTIAIEIDNKLKYVGDIKLFQDRIKSKSEENFYLKKSYRKAEKESIGNQNVCYICNTKSDKTYGYVSTFKFYNLDKKGFTSGGFNRGEAWKNYPVCPDCALALDQGRKYLEDNLSSSFSGIDYLIIPKTIFSQDDISEELMFKALDQLDEKKKFSFKKENREKLTGTQDDLFTIMKDFKNYMNFNLLFYREENSAFRILLYVEDILPSYLKEIFEIKKEIEKHEIYRKLKGKDEYYDLKFSFNILTDFFPVNDFQKSFLEIVDNIFSRQKTSYKYLLDNFMRKLRNQFVNQKPTKYLNLEALMILQFLMRLDLLIYRNKGGEIKMEVNENRYEKMVNQFFTDYKDFFDSDIKRGVFLEGVLAQKLLNIQYRDRNSTPFRSRLNGLKINKKIVQRLLPEMQNKLEEYGKNYYVKLERMISRYLLAGNFEEISNTEISFYFTTGMNLAAEFQFESEEK